MWDNPAQLTVRTMHGDASAQDGLWEMLDAEQAITIPHHPASAKLTYNWDYYDRGFVRLVEIFQSSRGNYEFADCFRTAADTVDTAYVQDGLSKNYQFGLIASSDHGSEACYAAVLAEELDRESIFTALRDAALRDRRRALISPRPRRLPRRGPPRQGVPHRRRNSR